MSALAYTAQGASLSPVRQVARFLTPHPRQPKGPRSLEYVELLAAQVVTRMLIKRCRTWEISEREATPESVYLNRRSVLAALGFSSAAAMFPACVAGCSNPISAGQELSAVIVPETKWSSLFPAARNQHFQLDRGLTPEVTNATFNNFSEFGSKKGIEEVVQALEIEPWTVTIDGLVEAERRIEIDTLLRSVTLEERLYRLRCVEGWSMTIPWSGFPMKALLDLAKPLSSAKFVRMETFNNPSIAPGQRQSWYPWPYVEGVTIDEAANDLAFLVVGTYGHVALKQHGAPLRLALPWKYGFKSIKSITRFTFTDEQPLSFWEAVQAAEYGFWANINPKVPHPRWSQETERVLHTGERIPTLIYNGYGEEVADLYTGISSDRLFQ